MYLLLYTIYLIIIERKHNTISKGRQTVILMGIITSTFILKAIQYLYLDQLQIIYFFPIMIILIAFQYNYFQYYEMQTYLFVIGIVSNKTIIKNIERIFTFIYLLLIFGEVLMLQHFTYYINFLFNLLYLVRWILWGKIVLLSGIVYTKYTIAPNEKKLRKKKETRGGNLRILGISVGELLLASGLVSINNQLRLKNSIFPLVAEITIALLLLYTLHKRYSLQQSKLPKTTKEYILQKTEEYRRRNKVWQNIKKQEFNSALFTPNTWIVPAEPRFSDKYLISENVKMLVSTLDELDQFIILNHLQKFSGIFWNKQPHKVIREELLRIEYELMKIVNPKILIIVDFTKFEAIKPRAELQEFLLARENNLRLVLNPMDYYL